MIYGEARAISAIAPYNITTLLTTWGLVLSRLGLLAWEVSSIATVALNSLDAGYQCRPVGPETRSRGAQEVKILLCHTNSGEAPLPVLGARLGSMRLTEPCLRGASRHRTSCFCREFLLFSPIGTELYRPARIGRRAFRQMRLVGFRDYAHADDNAAEPFNTSPNPST